jgi:hypothetical protein
MTTIWSAEAIDSMRSDTEMTALAPAIRRSVAARPSLQLAMAGRQCYHCKDWIEAGAPHDCWTTTEAALTRDLTEDLREAWERLRDAATELGEQRIYASHKSIMFSRKSCYFFVRPKKSVLEVCVFLGRALKHPRVRRVEPASKAKFAHIIPVRHRDEVEAPITDWLREAYERSGGDAPAPTPRATRPSGRSAKRAAPARTRRRPRRA